MMATGAGRGFLLDTNVLVAYIRAGRLGKYIEDQFSLRAAAYKPLVCIVSVGEIMSLARKFGWGGAKTSLMDRLLKELVWIDINDSRILASYAELDHLSESTGHPIGKNDLWIAAAAKATEAVLLTTDRHFDQFDPAHLKRTWIDEVAAPQG